MSCMTIQRLSYAFHHFQWYTGSSLLQVLTLGAAVDMANVHYRHKSDIAWLATSEANLEDLAVITALFDSPARHNVTYQMLW